MSGKYILLIISIVCVSCFSAKRESVKSLLTKTDYLLQLSHYETKTENTKNSVLTYYEKLGLIKNKHGNDFKFY